MKQTQEQRSKNIEELHEWCLAVIRLIKGLDQSTELYELAEESIDAALERSDLRGLRMVARDFEEWVSGLPMSDQLELDASLRQRFGRGLKSFG